MEAYINKVNASPEGHNALLEAEQQFGSFKTLDDDRKIELIDSVEAHLDHHPAHSHVDQGHYTTGQADRNGDYLVAVQNQPFIHH